MKHRAYSALFEVKVLLRKVIFVVVCKFPGLITYFRTGLQNTNFMIGPMQSVQSIYVSIVP